MISKSAVANQAHSKKNSVFSLMVNGMLVKVYTLVLQKNTSKQNYDGRDVVIKISEDQLIHLKILPG
jgi:hypothetical protein